MGNQCVGAGRSNFGKWVSDFGGTLALSKKLKCSQKTVQHWLAGRSQPRSHFLNAILKLSKGKLTLKDILDGVLE
jgi:hypothetical protein